MSTLADSDRKTSRPEGGGRVDFTIDDTGIATLRLGEPQESVVTWTEQRLESLGLALDSLASHSGLAGVLVTGPGPGMFCAGADVSLIAGVATPEEGEKAAMRGREIFAKLRSLEVPSVAAIDGPCLGGGLECALYCDARVASDDPRTIIGLPEVKLGIVPGFGGTQNLTRLVGLPTALDWILKGKTAPARVARKAGIVDRVAPLAKLLAAAREELSRLRIHGRRARRLPISARLLSAPPLRSLIGRKVRKTLHSGPARFYPAQSRALDLCLAAARGGDIGFALESRALGELIAGPVAKGLCRVFFLTERAKRLGKDPRAKALGRAMVVGGGVMGAGIAALLAERGLAVRLCDVDERALGRAKSRHCANLAGKRKRQRIERHEEMAAADRLAVSTEWGSLARTDLWLEAVVEDLDVKKKLLSAAVERGLSPHALIATNTSSLPIDEMASSVPEPERVVGIHFFNPPEKMPLVEVIRGSRTSEEAVASACALAVRLGKFPVVVRDVPGFLVNRCLSRYLDEAARLLIAGNEPEFLDRVMLDFGMPMGPCLLLDRIGYDVACKVGEVMHAAYGARMAPSPLFGAMVEAGVLGTKSGGGLFGKDSKDAGPGRKVLADLRAGVAGGPVHATRTEVRQRLVYPMVDEVFRCIDENVVEHEDDADLGLIMGIGFPPFTGGITRFAAAEGFSTIASSLDELSRVLDPRFTPSDGLRRRAVHGAVGKGD
ncbi:MAG: fatty acid oxidation complex subunit alpha FadJ [Planctomycetota bacterium]